MNKRAITRILITSCWIILVAFFSYRFYRSQKILIEAWYDGALFVDRDQIPYKPSPISVADYPEGSKGSYRFNPNTIFASLDQGKDVFKEMDDADLEYTGIGWTQADFLRIANALSQKVWHEPLDLDAWDVYSVSFSGSCHDSLTGFNSFEITYYKITRIGWETVYKTRHIDLTPSLGLAFWGGDGVFSTPFIFAWENTQLTKFKIPAEQAFRIVEENGGRAAPVNGEKYCSIDVYSDGYYGDNWDVYYDITEHVLIDPFTGEVHSTK